MSILRIKKKLYLFKDKSGRVNEIWGSPNSYNVKLSIRVFVGIR
ncbi:hypothetical protein SAMN04489724_0395 [Algoriphagus locisalis]|uniref:Uncharacterized protein n=1 Tax=Algoriphagus locisalis TaxID=305507 RepID=A0A1I6XC14_9BACT|nr:hypothetical protein SAMN04489724_0395 [Algoriphagus locisalis]